MPYFSFSTKQTKPQLSKFNIKANNVYFSKDTTLWKLLNKQNKTIIKFLKRERRIKLVNIQKNILFCLPPSIGLGDAIEYVSAINLVCQKINFDKVAVAFTGDYSFLFKKYFKQLNIYKYIIEKCELEKFDTIFHFTLEIKNLESQKYIRSNILEETLNYFNLQKIKKKNISINKNVKINKISIFPLSRSPLRSMPIQILNNLTKLLTKNFDVEIFLDQNFEISNFILDNIKLKNVKVIDPKDKMDLINLIKKIQYGIFMDSGPLHVAKLFSKRGILIESTVSKNILLNNYNLIKCVENQFSSNFCNAPCGLTDIFNLNNNFGCYDSLKIKSDIFKNNNFKNLTNRGAKNKYLEVFKNPVGCLSSLNVQNIYNVIKKDLLL